MVPHLGSVWAELKNRGLSLRRVTISIGSYPERWTKAMREGLSLPAEEIEAFAKYVGCSPSALIKTAFSRDKDAA